MALHPDPERLVNVQGWDQGASEFWRKSEEYTFLRCSRNFSDAPFKLNRPHLRFQMIRKLALMKEGGRSKTIVMT